VDSGELRVWDSASGVPLQAAVASSAAVPGVYPPLTIGASRYMDGGMRSALNANLAAGHDAVVAISCFALEMPEEVSDPTFDAINAALGAELDTVRRSGSLEVVVPGPEFLELSGWGLQLMVFSRAEPAFGVGLRQADAEAEGLRRLWGH